MSRIGKKPIKLADGISYNFDQSTGEVTVKGPKGELKQQLDPAFKLVENEGELTIERPTEQKRHKALHGLYRSLINNMV
ncbi:MAG: 50S ribosomal protein L6, partial [Bacteroidota bacterium]